MTEEFRILMDRLDDIDRLNKEILRQLFNKVNVARIETSEPNPKVLRIEKISETPEGLYIRVS